jgi:hypothetical protein
MWMIQGSLRTPDRLLELSGSYVQQSEVFRTMTGAHEPYNSCGSATDKKGMDSEGAHYESKG